MKSAETKKLDSADIDVRVQKLREELFSMRVKSSTETLDNPARIGQIRREVARLLTEQSRRAREGGK